MAADLLEDAVFSSINYTNQKSKFTECRILLSPLFYYPIEFTFWAGPVYAQNHCSPKQMAKRKWLGRVDISA